MNISVNPWFYIGLIVFLGILYTIYQIGILRKDVQSMYKYMDCIHEAYRKKKQNENYNNENGFLQKNVHKMMKIMDDYPYSSTSQLITDFNKLSLYSVNDEQMSNYVAFFNRCLGRKQTEQNNLIKHFFNPFILLYSGISCILAITVSPLIQQINPQFNTENKWYNFIFTIISVIASFITIFDYYSK